jgi:hypothetical protein
MTLVEKLDALQEQQSEISALVVKVHILATALNDENAALRAENERQTAGWEKALSDLQQYQTHILDLETDNERLRGVLKPFARTASLIPVHWDTYRQVWRPIDPDLTVNDFREASDALEEPTDG